MPVSADLQVQVETTRETEAVVAVSGELDIQSSPRLRDSLVSLIDEGFTTLVLVCADLRFVDSTGLGVLVAALKHARERDGDVVIRAPSHILARLLSITKLDGVFRIE